MQVPNEVEEELLVDPSVVPDGQHLAGADVPVDQVGKGGLFVLCVPRPVIVML